jgi:hypothetical protein
MILSRINALHFATLFTLIASGAGAQQFHFGGGIGLVASQVDGDNLRGFNKLGYSAGIVGGFAIHPEHWIVVELQYATFGSNQRKETSAIKLETDLRSINVLCGYAIRFGDAWDGSKKFRAMPGLRLHALQKAVLGKEESLDLVDRYFVSLNLSFGLLLTDRWILDLTYNQGLSDILKEDREEISKLNPYYLTLGVVYYLNN